MHAVLRIDLQTVAVVVVFYILIHTSGSVAALWARVLRQIDSNGNRSVFEREMRGLVFFVVGVADENATQPVEGQLAIGFGVVDFCKLGCRLQVDVIRLAATQCPRWRADAEFR